MNQFDAKMGILSETTPQVTLRRSIIVEELRLLYVPVSKAACTSLRWLLADLIGMPAERFEDPTKFRATQGQTIQNTNRWPPRYLVQSADPGWLDEVAEAEDWLRFSVVRDPARRLWSAWQSKLLLRQPRFVRTFGEEPWFPGVPSSPEEVLESYELFVAALDTEDESRRPTDPHWRLQTELLGEDMRSLNHIGRVEMLGDTLERLREHVAQFGRDLPTVRRENVTPLPYPDGLLSDETTRVIREYYAPDYSAFGYDESRATRPSEDACQEWKERTGILLDSVRMLIAHNERMATLDRSLQHTRRRAEKVGQDNQKVRQDNRRIRQDSKKMRRESRKVRQDGRKMRRVLVERDKEISRVRNRVATLEQELRALRESHIWLYTAPLRRLAYWVRLVKGKISGDGAG